MVGIIISSVANDFTAMLIGRTIQGVGGGGIILLNDVVITDLVPMRLRGAYFGIIGAVWGFGSVAGPVVGGVLSVKTTWVGHVSAQMRVKYVLAVNVYSDGSSGSTCHSPRWAW